MISRCPLGLPIRYRTDEGTTDFTDSAFLTGMLGLFGSEEKPWKYLELGHGPYGPRLVRHPVGDHNDQRVTKSENTSRDQLVAWASVKTKDEGILRARRYYARKWFINKDFLGLHVTAYLALQGKAYFLFTVLLPFALIWMFFDLLIFHAIVPRFQKVEDQHEINQALCLYSAFGLAKLLLWLHPTPDENMKDYYCTWRNQCEIYEMYLKWKESL